ncbi:MAG: SprT-like domain-containing protein [Bacteroidota bacterium]
MTPGAVFQKFVPEKAITYCVELFNVHGFEFKIKKARQTKLGDYRYDPRFKKHTITINNDLNQYAFLITYLHEVAHLIANKRFGSNIQPHGKEWKESFKKVALPVLNEQVFAPDVLVALKKYFRNPKATSCSDPELHQLLRSYDPVSDKVLLKEIKNGECFIFNKRTFKKIDKKRSRSLCEELSSRKRYLIQEIAEVVRKI